MSQNRHGSWSFRPLLFAMAVGALVYVGILGLRFMPAALGALVLCALVYVAPIAAGLGDDYVGGRRLERLRDHRLAIREGQLHQTSPDGACTSIDLNTPFTHQYLYRADGEAVYRIRQGRTRLDFASSDPLASEVVQDVLGLHWPPRAMRGVSG